VLDEGSALLPSPRPILKERGAGMKTADLCISEVSFYNWKAKLKKLLADAMLDNAALKDLLAKKW
jgi:putative transposase